MRERRSTVAPGRNFETSPDVENDTCSRRKQTFGQFQSFPDPAGRDSQAASSLRSFKQNRWMLGPDSQLMTDFCCAFQVAKPCGAAFSPSVPRQTSKSKRPRQLARQLHAFQSGARSPAAEENRKGPDRKDRIGHSLPHDLHLSRKNNARLHGRDWRLQVLPSSRKRAQGLCRRGD